MDWRDFVTVKTMHVFTRLRLIRILSLSASKHRLSDFFKGLENVEAVRQIFGESTEQVLHNLTVELTWIGGYMWVNASDGHLMIDSRYLSKGSRVDIYLDIIHELVHVRQLMEGKELFDVGYSYVERPTEVEAYRYAVREAKRLGLSSKRICEYLRTEWMSDDDVKRLAKTLNIECT